MIESYFNIIKYHCKKNLYSNVFRIRALELILNDYFAVNKHTHVKSNYFFITLNQYRYKFSKHEDIFICIVTIYTYHYIRQFSNTALELGEILLKKPLFYHNHNKLKSSELKTYLSKHSLEGSTLIDVDPTYINLFDRLFL